MILAVVIHPHVYEDATERLAILTQLKLFADGVVLVDSSKGLSRAGALARFIQFVLNMRASFKTILLA